MSHTQYKQNSGQNQKILTTETYANTNLKLPKDFYFDVRFNYNNYKNKRFGFDQQIPILNAFVYKLLGKEKKWEIRASAYDILKKSRP